MCIPVVTMKGMLHAVKQPVASTLILIDAARDDGIQLFVYLQGEDDIIRSLLCVTSSVLFRRKHVMGKITITNVLFHSGVLLVIQSVIFFM